MAVGRGPGAPSEAEIQIMLAQMREAPAEQILVEVANILLQAVQVKLGRPDARLLLDAVAAVAAAANGRADATLVTQVEQAISQLRLAQVEEEARLAPGDTEAATPAGPPSAPQSVGPEAPVQASEAGGPARSRLWVPGR